MTAAALIARRLEQLEQLDAIGAATVADSLIALLDDAIAEAAPTTLSTRLLRLLREHGDVPEVQAAVELGVHWRQIVGAVLALRRRGHVVRITARRKIVRLIE